MKIKRETFHGALASLALLVGSQAAHASIVWNWSIDSEHGQIVTSGDVVDGHVVAGTYGLEDFSVQSSAYPVAIGSLSGGQYAADAFGTTLPYNLLWDGDAVSKWDSAGSNGFDWWVFGDVTSINWIYFFGWNVNNTNDVTSGALYSNYSNREVLAAPIHIAPVTSVPEPASISLFALGLLGAGLARRKRTHV